MFVFRGLSCYTALVSVQEEEQGISLLAIFPAEADLFIFRKKTMRKIGYQLYFVHFLNYERLSINKLFTIKTSDCLLISERPNVENELQTGN